MKRKIISGRILAFAAFMLIGLMGLTAMAAGRAKGEVSKKVHDFGMVKEDGGPVACDFEIMNTGDGNLVIIDGKADCGCTRPTFPKAPIAPGKKGVVKVTYNPLGRPGSFDKVVTLKTNGSPKTLRLKIKGTVIPKGE
ncbi:MAG: DUF1573 domain-containing protein [Muribaculaceae bacterium]|nr:DUF1573 domain-containing protein [Muribaculaceae bacterium]